MISEQRFRERAQAIGQAQSSEELPLADIMARGAVLRRRQRRRTMAAAGVAALVLVTGGAMSVGQMGGLGDQVMAASQPQEMSPAVRTELAEKVRDALEGPGGLMGNANPVACGVHILGTDPENVSSAAQVRTVYVQASCEGHFTQEFLSGASGPVAVHLSATPPAVDQPGNGSRYSSDIRRIFPERLWDAAFANAKDVHDKLESQVLQRLREKSMTLSPRPSSSNQTS